MSTSIWTHIRRFAPLAGLAGVLLALYPLYDCTQRTAELLFSPAYPDIPAEELELARIARGELVEETTPPGVSRWSVAAPVCVDAIPPIDFAPGAALALFGFFGWFVGWRGERFAGEDGLPEREERDELEERKRDVSLARPKPLSAEADVVPLDVDVDEAALGLGKAAPAAEAHLYDDDGETLMAFVQEQQDAPVQEELPEATEIDGFYCPPGYGNKPVCYVDPSHPEATDNLSGDESFDNLDRPFATLDGALEHARRRIVTDAPGVMIRLLPGVYQGTADIPDRVCVVNHRTPAEGDDAARLRWISGLSVDHPDAVTILPPADAAYGVKLAPGRNHGLVGVHVVSREGARQTGITAQGAAGVAILYCVVEGFSSSGVELTLCGKESAAAAVQIRGCLFRGNSSAEGGGLRFDKSFVRVHTCIVTGNRARSGGGIAVRDSASIHLVRTRLEGNRAEAKPPEVVDPERMPLSAWGQAQGLGGGLSLLRSKVLVRESEFVDNGASLGGGGIAAVHSALLVDGDDSTPVRIARNKSRNGGGLLLVGLRSGATTARLDQIDVSENIARVAGGGACVVGLAEAKVSDATFSDNRAEGDDATGGGVSIHLGGRFLAVRTRLERNRARHHGGGVAAINASLKLGEKSACLENVSGGEGGGIYAITRENAAIEELINSNEIGTPFVLDIEEARFRRNVARGPGGGLRVGNTIEQPTPALGVRLNPARIGQNVTRSENAASSDLWIEWAGDIVASALTKPERKFVLK